MIEIRKAVRQDAEAMLVYMKQIGGESDNLTFGAEGLPVSIQEEEAYIAGMEQSCDDVIVIAVDQGRIVGDASLNRLPRRMCHRGDLGIAVVKAYWNQGVGSLLLSEIIDFARKNQFDIIELQVRSDNLPAIHLYEKFGFRKFGTHPAFFRLEGKEIPCDYMWLNVTDRK